jgi:toluene monooxygenase system protein E
MSGASPLRPIRTWSHLAGQRRRPSEYEIVSTNLLWHTRDAEHPWDVDCFMSGWYRRNLFGSPLRHADWDAFRDPDELVYRTYNVMQDGQEAYVDGLLEQHARQQHDAGLSAPWIATLATLYTPSRYPLHAVQMASAYLASIAPASTISNCAIFQSADALRWVSRVAYRTRELANLYPESGLAADERRMWERAPPWQGFRELIERVLATYEWGEAFFALNVICKPALDETLGRQFAAAARRNRDTVLALLADARLRDSARSFRWTQALIRMALQTPGNQTVLRQWADVWAPRAEAAVRAFCARLPESPDSGEAAVTALREFRSSLTL